MTHVADPRDTRIDAPLLDFRQWLAQKLQLTVPDAPQALVDTARSAHPDLDTWIDRWMTERS